MPLKCRDEENHTNVDENYLQALEWGLPPTGGWGCGIDRLCMLFSGAGRISDVLSFGSLRNVVGLGAQPKKIQESPKQITLDRISNDVEASDIQVNLLREAIEQV